MRRRPEEVEPAIVAGLREHGLLEIVEPEHAVDKTATEKLATAMTDVITSGVLDDLAKEETAFHELSMSRLGSYGDEGLYKMLFEELKQRGLARDSVDNVSIPMHPKVRSLVLVLLSQILRPYGRELNAILSPITDVPKLVRALAELVSVNADPTVGGVMAFDLSTVTVDFGPVPIDEALDFREQNLDAHKRYMLSVRKFTMELSRMPEEERKLAFEMRQAELDDIANDLRKRARKAWKKPSSFALTLVGSAISAVASPVTSLLRLAASAAGYEKAGNPDTGPYSYLFKAAGRFD